MPRKIAPIMIYGLLQLLILVGVSCLRVAWGATYYVATTGSDLNSGTTFQPFRTIQKGVDSLNPGDTLIVKAGTYYERINITKSGTASQPITVKGERGSAGEYLTVVDGTEDQTSGWVSAPEIATGVFKKNLGFDPSAMTFDADKHAWKIHTVWMSGNTNTDGLTGQNYMARAGSFTSSWPVGCPSVNWWDAIGEVIFGYDSRNGTTYVRFKNGDNPSTRRVRLSRGTGSDGVFTLNAKSYITISDFQIQGHRFGVLIYSTSATSAQGNIIENNKITNNQEKVYLGDRAQGNKIRNNTFQLNTNIPYFGAWEWNCDSTQKTQASQNYLFTKRAVDKDDSETRTGIVIGAYGAPAINNEIYSNTIRDGIVALHFTGYAGTAGTKVYSNTIRNHSAQGDWPNEGVTYELFDNLFANNNNAIRFQNFGYGPRNIDVYRNRFWNPVNTGIALYIDQLGMSQNSTNRLRIYHNSISGFYYGVSFADFSGSTNCNNCLVLNNVINSNDALITSDATFCPTTNKVGAYDYNFHRPSKGGCAWYGQNNMGSSTAVWNLGSEPSDWSLPTGHPARSAGIDLSQSFTVNGKSYPALPGMTQGNFSGATISGATLSGARPDLGAVQPGSAVTSSVSSQTASQTTSAVARAPFSGKPFSLPGVIQAEDFDNGGEGVSYHDAGTGNSGGSYRTADVDIEPTSDVGGGYNVSGVYAGEWLEYSVIVSVTGSYNISARVASNGPGGTFHVEFDQVNVTGSLAVPDTGGWQNWTTVTKSNVTLAAGTHILRIAADTNGPSGSFGNINYLSVSSSLVRPSSPVNLVVGK